jgi:hypothetical protein
MAKDAQGHGSAAHQTGVEEAVNPRKAGFNYGTGWGSAPKPPIFAAGEALAQRLGAAAIAASRDAWEVDHAVRDVRLAETPEEKTTRVATLTALVHKHSASGMGSERGAV